MIKPTQAAVIYLVAASLAAGAASAESVLERLPEDAIGFVLVRDLGKTNAKIEGVFQIFQNAAPMPIPAPLAIVKAATGLGPGLNEQGEALLALLPGEDGLADSRPLLLIAVSDYAAFAAGIQGDATGEICRVTLADEEVLVAKLGDYAALMNVEHRERLEELLTSEPRSHAGIQPLNDWLQSQDVSITLTPRGADMLAQAAQAELTEQAVAMRRHMAPQPFEQLQQAMAVYDDGLTFLSAEVEAVAVGVSIVDDSNVKLSTQAVLNSSGKLSKFAASLSSTAAALEGFANKPYVVAAGGQFTPEFAQAIADLNLHLLKSDPRSHGFEKLTDEDWRIAETSWRDYTQGVQAASFAAYLDDDDDPLVSNIGGKLTVDNSSRYLNAYAASIEQWQTLLNKSTLDIDLEYRLSEIEVAGRKGLLTSVNMGKALEDPNVPSTNFISDALFGEDGQFRIYLAPTDDHTIAFGVDDREGFARTIRAIAETDNQLADAAGVQTTLQLLPSRPSWTGIADPRSVAAWLERLYNKLFAQLGPVAFELPDYPESPPIGFAVTISDNRLSGEAALPKQFLEALAEFIETLQKGGK
jgi:hypothetical protein